MIELDLAAADSFRSERKRLHDAAQARIARKRRDQTLRTGQSFGGFPDLGGGAEQQTIAFEELAAVGLADRWKQVSLSGEPPGQRIGGQFRILGGRCLDDYRNAVLREGLRHLELALMPGEIPRDQAFDVGVDGELCGGERAGGQHEERPGDERGPPVIGAYIDDPDNHCIDHGEWPLSRKQKRNRGVNAAACQFVLALI